jgi:hypothetical protein
LCNQGYELPGGDRNKMNKSKLGIIFSFLVLIYAMLLYFEMPEHRFETIAFPLIFVSLASLAALLKILLDISGSSVLRRMDGISLLKMEAEKPAGEAASSSLSTKKEIGFTISFASFFLFIYLIGFLAGTFIFSSLYTYLLLRKVKTAIITAVSLTALTYLASAILPGGLWRGILLGA